MAIVKLTDRATKEVVDIDTEVWTLINASDSNEGAHIILEKLGGERWLIATSESGAYVRAKL